jgi:serine/threonine-protein kinase
MRKRTINRRYKVIKKISKSHMSVVYKVRDILENNVFGLKACHPSFDKSSRMALGKEYVVLSQLKHPIIVEVLQLDLAGEGSVLMPGTLFFTMEYLEGKTLDRLDRLNIRKVEMILIQVLQALGAIHSKGFVYGDLKPHNIMCRNRNGELIIRLFDFGLTVREGYRVNGREISGTLNYIAPEMFRGGRIDRRTDLYSLGVLLYELTTGVPPFPRKDIISIAQGHLFDTPVSPRSINAAIPQGLKHLILKLLQKDPDHRFQSIEDVMAYLNQCSHHTRGSNELDRNRKMGKTKNKAGRDEFLKISEKPSPSAFSPPGFKRGKSIFA